MPKRTISYEIFFDGINSTKDKTLLRLELIISFSVDPNIYLCI